MDFFNYRDGVLHAEQVPVVSIAEQFGTPCYVYSRATIERHWHAFDRAFGPQDHLICYSVKANSNLGVLNLLARLGSGFDIVSGGELERVLRAGGDAGKIVFSGVGKTAAEIEQALYAGVRCFNVESIAELHRLNTIARAHHKNAHISIRVNPDVDAKTHPYISTGLKDNKFGIDMAEAVAVYKTAATLPNLRIVGIDCHIGSQLTTLAPFLDALDRVLLLVDQLQVEGIAIHHLDLGGGLGIKYNDETPPEPAQYAQAVCKKLGDRKLEVLLEPGRAIIGNAGILLTRVEYLKHTAHKNFAIVDAAMNDLIRPALYDAWQNIIPVQESGYGTPLTYDIVGPVCETGDFLGKSRMLGLQEGALLAVRSAGAYGFVMSSNYNTRPRVAEIMVDGEQAHVVRTRETVNDLMRGENILP